MNKQIKSVMGIAIIALLIAISASGEVTTLTNFTLRVQGQPKLDEATLIAGGNVTLFQDSVNKTIRINASGGTSGNYVLKSGDTMTGNLSIDTESLVVNNIYPFAGSNIFVGGNILKNTGLIQVPTVKANNISPILSADIMNVSNFAGTGKINIDSSGNVDMKKNLYLNRVYQEGNDQLYSTIIYNNTNYNLNLVSFRAIGNTSYPYFAFASANGNTTNPLPPVLGKQLVVMAGTGYVGGTWGGTRVAINYEAAEDWSTTTQGTNMIFQTTANGTTTVLKRMIINDTGVVQINQLAGSGNAYACIDSAGKLYRGSPGC